MPVASSSRTSRRQRRAPSSDIEEDGPSQAPPPQEDIEMDEDEEPRRAKKEKKKEKKRKQQDSDGEDVPEEEVEDVPIPELGDQPLDRSQAPKVHGMSSDWGLLRDKVHSVGYGFIREVASSVAEFTEGEKGEKALSQVDALMRELLDTEFELTAHEKVLEDVHQKLVKNEKIEGITDVYQKGVEEMLEAYKHNTARQKYAKSDQYQKFHQAIYEVQHPDAAMPPLTDLIAKGNDDDDDVQIGGVTQDYKCPLTLTILVEPLTSKLCGHSYSAAAIKEYLNNSRNIQRECPATGCKKQISLGIMESNKDLAKRAKEAERRERAREEDSGDEEVIE
ncbi:hypothetical protein C2E23DRAFT_867274 [Lenzites betulinus]|nr:hypothetical protein C2E23DRAFT_867274 [Lenzites betulinus]